jgi:hypothetical protein
VGENSFCVGGVEIRGANLQPIRMLMMMAIREIG